MKCEECIKELSVDEVVIPFEPVKNKRQYKMRVALVSVVIITGIIGAVIVDEMNTNSYDETYGGGLTVMQAPYHKIDFTVSDNSKDCNSDYDYFLVLRVEDDQKVSTIACKYSELQINSWDISWGEGVSGNSGLSLNPHRDYETSVWTTDTFYFFIGFQNSEGTWHATCKTTTLDNGYNETVDYCNRNWDS